jgi:DNA processing protein
MSMTMPAIPAAPASFADVWSGPANRTAGPDLQREAFAIGALTVLTEPADARIVTAVRTLSATSTLEMIIDPDESTLTQRAAALGYAVEQIRAMRRNQGLIATAFDLAKKHSIKLVTVAEGSIPGQFADLGDTQPLAFWIRGDRGLLDLMRDGLSVEGSRASTSYGEHVAETLVEDAVRAGRVIVSGGSYGIQGAAHRRTLTVGGKTVLIAALGLDRAYPAGHSDLQQRVASTGLLISELAPGAAPTRWRLQSRARLLAAATAATVVVEAGARSGALRTAGIAMNLGRVSCAVPGPVTSAASRGTHELIHQGTARLVTSWADVEELTAPPLTTVAAEAS